ncbi:unnamed protein product, partial [Mesorhabditis belari]|uniref:Uncharacterized protein n=1 Tax=Mesorhabditis belari TaxID=2138241 RepID=A0AAF3FBE5_9BILA
MKKNDEKLSKFWIFRILWFFVFPFEISSVILDAGVITWQLHNQCTQGFLQSYLKHVDANGDMNSRCLTDFIVHTSPTGLIRLQHALSKVYICFNRRRQLITKLQSRRNKGCYFYERISEAGYTEIESAAEPGLFLGFNRKGYRQDPFTYWTRRKCFSFMKKSQKWINVIQVINHNPESS